MHSRMPWAVFIALFHAFMLGWILWDDYVIIIAQALRMAAIQAGKGHCRQGRAV